MCRVDSCIGTILIVHVYSHLSVLCHAWLVRCSRYFFPQCLLTYFSLALPDGTFLIVNGAKQGVAGFGLADFPNLQALLYDPSQPVHQRISILNSTIVARLYHSEATVSGLELSS